MEIPVRQLDSELLTVREMRYMAPHDFPPHTDAAPKLIFTLSGSVRESYDDVSVECNPQSVTFIPPQRMHSDRFISDVHALIVTIKSPRLQEACADLAGAAAAVQIPSILCASLREQIERELLADEVSSPLLIASFLLDLFGRVQSVSRARRRPPPLIESAVRYITDRDGYRLTAQQIAKALNVAPRTLSRHFEVHFGVSPGEFVARVRMSSAATSLRETRRPIGEISRELGFFDQAHFSRSFRRSFGMSPREYRRLADTLKRDPVSGRPN